VRRTMEAAERLIDATAEPGPALLFGSIHQEAGQNYNVMILAEDGRMTARTLKRELPNYGTFDEKRVFASGPLPEPIHFRGVKIGVPICEDIWQEIVCAHLANAGAELMLVPNGSPYELDKDDKRATLVRSRVTMTGLPLVYLNRVGGQDEIVFDGSSFIMHPDGSRVVQFPDWEEKLLLTEWTREPDGWRCATRETHELDPYPEDVYQAMVVGLRDYVNRNGFPGVLLGLSGGIDSALSAAIAVDALGPDKVWGVMLPSKYTSDESLDDARECARLLGCRHDVISIAPGVAAMDEALATAFEGTTPGLAEENIQARLRMVALMALSNKFGPMLLTTGNKSEMSVGYATLYGDMSGGYNVLKDAYKTTVFALSRWRNQNRPEGALGPDGPVMPANVITKPPTAELRPNQKDEDSLPPYSLLDRILEGLIDKEMSVREVANMTGAEFELVASMEKLLLRAEYKRRQAPPGVKIGSRNFGRDRRYPISNFFHTGHR
jgi:NAD+ synthase